MLKKLETKNNIVDAARDIFSSFTYPDPNSFIDPKFWAGVVTIAGSKVNLKNETLDCSKNFAEIITNLVLLFFTTREYFENLANKMLEPNSSKEIYLTATLPLRILSSPNFLATMPLEIMKSMQNSLDTASYIQTVSSLTMDGFKFFTKCFPTVVNAFKDTPFGNFMNSFKSSLEKFLDGSLVFYTLAKCGYQLTESSILLLLNVNCMDQDFKGMYDSYALSKRLNASLFNTLIDCDEESKNSCSTIIAQRYGMALSKARPIMNPVEITQTLKQGILDVLMNPWALIPVSSAPQKAASLCSTAYNKMTQPEYCYQACYGKELSKKLCYELDLGNTKNLEVCRNKCAEQEGYCLSDCVYKCCDSDHDCIKKVIHIYNCNSN